MAALRMIARHRNKPRRWPRCRELERRFGARERELCPVVGSLGELQDLILERAA